jgi:hypothetical protein
MVPKSAALALFAVGYSHASIISVNYDVLSTSTPALAPTDVAGAVAAANWNNVEASATGQAFNYGITYLDNLGSATTLTVAASSGTGDTWNTVGTADEIIFGDKSNFAGGIQTLSLSNVPYALFDVYIYASYWGNEVVSFTVGSTTHVLTNTFTPQFSGGPDFVLDDTYVKFSGLSGDVVISMLPSSGGLHLGGFQIADAIPEPSTLFLAGLAPALLFMRRRRSA